MTTDIQLLRSSIANKRPALAPLLDGQAAVNLNPVEPGLFFKDSTGNNLIKIGPVAVNTTGAAPNSSPIGSTGNAIGETWLDGRTTFASPVLKVWDGVGWSESSGFTVDDADGNYSLDRIVTLRSLIAEGTGDDSHITVPNDSTANRPSTPVAGMFRLNTTLSLFEGYNGSSWDPFTVGGGSGVFVDLTVTGDSVLGDDCSTDTLTINSVTTLNCDATIGATNANTLTITSLIASDVLPNADGSLNLGSATETWNLFATDISAVGNTVLGDDAATDTVTITAALTQNGESSFLEDATMWNRQEMRFSAANIPDPAAAYISLRSPATVSATTIFNLPDGDGTSGQVLSTDGSGNLSWANNSGGGGGAVDSIIAGDNITISPVSGTGDVTINATGGGNMTLVDLTVTGDTILGDSCVDDTLTVNSVTTFNCEVLPGTDNTHNFGSPTQRWANIYTGDLHLKNDRGDWTMIEEEDYLSLRNNKTGKIFKITMEAID